MSEIEREMEKEREKETWRDNTKIESLRVRLPFEYLMTSLLTGREHFYCDRLVSPIYTLHTILIYEALGLQVHAHL